MDKLALKKDMLKKVIKEMMGKGGEGLKKVTVMAKDPEGLKEGLEKAEEMLEGSTEGCETCEKEDCPGCESDDEYSSMSKEQLLELLKKK